MCTVSFVNNNSQYIITSNRDEKLVRPNAIEPKNYLINNKKITFPKDPKAGGTWFAVAENGTIAVLLNGAAEKHEFGKTYKRSRGLIVLDLIANDSAISFWYEIDLENIEPFTLILFQENQLYQLRWNEIEKETIQLDSDKNYIWSSSTLYSKEVRDQRQQWFFEFLENKNKVSDSEIIDFHQYTENENQDFGLIINRNNTTKTVSITQAISEKNKISLVHKDLIAHKDYMNSFLMI